MIVGILSIVNGILLKSKNGKLSMNVTTILVSLTEFLWLIVCVYSLFQLNFPNWTSALPASYVSYVIVVSYNVNKLTKGMRKKELFEFKVPDLYIGTDIAFSALYFLASGVALWQNYY
ncbi:MAG: hypothetical protein DRR08_17720 [Candidatus Parabeggiatoa sp. nov. 2]|nr:MAG: hypothetical protein DRR08_17720 [Gammaproteobacteria bacterium]